MKLADITEYEEYGNKKKNVTVSIWCLTYNHVKYIKDTFEGFLNQKTNFDIEVLVYDDASTDGTSDIVREYSMKYPDIFHTFISKENLYRHPNRQEALNGLKKENLTGKYIAMCEGDDYWIYNQKLQKQYDFMEGHSDVSMCYHNSIRVNESAKEYVPQIIDMDSQEVSIFETVFCTQGIPPTASYFFRRDAFFSLPKTVMYSPVGDTPLRWWCANSGIVYYMNKCWSVRNYLHKESWNYRIKNIDNKRKFYIEYAKFLSLYVKDLKVEFKPFVDVTIVNYYFNYFKTFISDSFSIDGYMELVDGILIDNNINKDVFVELSLYEVRRLFNDYYGWLIDKLHNEQCDIYIYGAGKEAAIMADILLKNNVNFCGFLVSVKNYNQNAYLGKMVYGIDEIKDLRDCNIVLGLNFNNRKEVFNMLYQRDARKVY